MYVIGDSGVAYVNEYALSTAFDIYTATYVQNFLVAIQVSAPTGIAFNNDGTKMYVIGDSGDGVNEYALSTAFDISTATFVQIFSVAIQESAPTGIAFNNDGTKMYVIGDSGVAYVNEYDLYITQ